MHGFLTQFYCLHLLLKLLKVIILSLYTGFCKWCIS